MSLQLITKTAQAERDLEDIWLYIAMDNIPAADALLDTIVRQCQLLQEQPLMGKARPELATHVRSLPVERYVVFYIPSEKGIEIVRVLHAARDVGGAFHG